MFSKVLLTFLGFARAAVGEELQTCGVAQYYPSQYTCFDNVFICPTGPSGTYSIFVVTMTVIFRHSTRMCQ